MTSRSRSVLLAALACTLDLLTPAAVIGQVNTADLVLRTIADESVALPRVAVVLRSVETGLKRQATTDADGNATIRALRPGQWLVSASRDTFQPIQDQALVLRVGQTARLMLTMRPLVSAALTVSGEMPVVDFYKMDTSTNILPEQIAFLPVPDRQFERLSFLAPAVQPDPTAYFGRTGAPVLGSAGSAWSNTYVVDGIDLTDPGNGLPALSFSQDAIREFRVIPSGFDAEIGLSPGGALSMITRTGANELSGSVFGFYRADALRSRGALEEESVDFSRYHAGFTVGGPIVQDRTHFFVSFEHVDDDNIALFRPGGDFVDEAEDVPHTTVQTMGLASLDHSFSTASSGLAKLVYNRRREENEQVGGVAAPSHGWTHDYEVLMLQLGHTWIMAEDRLNELHVQAYAGHLDAPLNASGLGEWFSSGSTLQVGANPNGDAVADRSTFNLHDTFHWQMRQRHALSAGLAYQHYRWSMENDRFQHGLLMYQDDTRNWPFMYFFGTGSSRVDYETDVIGVFFQDDWRCTERLTVGLGLRYDLDRNGNNPDFEHPLVSERSLDTDNLQPRLGLAWDVAGNGRTVVRGGVGRYTGRFFHFPAMWELQFNGDSGRVLRTNISSLIFGDPSFPINPEDPENTGIPLAPDITLLADDLEAAESIQANAGFSHLLGESHFVLEADLMWAEGTKELVFRDTNWKGNSDPCMALSPPACRINTEYTKIDRYTGVGRSRYTALTVGVTGTLNGGHLVSASVIVADKNSIMDDAQTPERPSDSANVGGEWGRSRVDERYRLVLSGVFRLPWGLTVAPIYEYGSGRPWNRLLGYDANGDGSLFDRAPEVARNDQDGPPYRQLSLRLTKTVPLGGRGRLDLIVEAFNLFNTTNYDVTSVDNAEYLRPGEPNLHFGTYTATLPPREIQLGLRYVF